MSLGRQFNNLNQGIEACQGALDSLIKKRENKDINVCPPSKSNCKKVFLPGGNAKSHHKDAKVPVKSVVVSKDKFKTDRAVVEVEVQCSPCKTGMVSKKNQTSDVEHLARTKDQVQMKQKHCWSKILKAQNENLPSNEAPDKLIDHQCNSYLNENLGAFSNFNPIRTLQFLITELRSKLKRTNQDHLLHLIVDMEGALFRLVSQRHDTHCSKVNPRNTEPDLNSREILRKLEDSYNKLEQTCNKMEVTCSRLREDKSKLARDLTETSQKLDFALQREHQMALKLAESSEIISVLRKTKMENEKSIEELKERVERLQTENAAVISLKEMQSKLNSRLTQILNDNAKISGEKQLLLIEREKLNAFIAIKDRELEKFRNYVTSIGSIVNKELGGPKVHPLLESDDSSSSISSSCLSTKLSQGLVSSSPNTTAMSSSPGPYQSWQVMSEVRETSPVKHRRGRHPGPQVKRQMDAQPHCIDSEDSGSRISSAQPLESIKNLKTELGDFFKQMAQKVKSKNETELENDTCFESVNQAKWSDLVSTTDLSEHTGAGSHFSNLSLP